MLAWYLQNDGGDEPDVETPEGSQEIIETGESVPGGEEAAGGGEAAAGPDGGSQPGETKAASEELIVVPDAAETLGSAAETLRETTEEIMPEPVVEFSEDLAGYSIFGVSVLELLLGFLAVLITMGIRSVILKVIDRYMKPYVEKTETEYDDKLLAALRRAVSYFVMLGGWFVAFSIIKLPSSPVDLQAGVWRVLNTLFLVLGGLLVYRIIEIAISYLAQKRDKQGTSVLDNQFVPLIRDVVKVAVVVLVVIAIIQSWGYSATGLLAGVGIGGLALAFAAQDTVANIFGSFVIYADRPYHVGDWILIGGVEGTVEEIGIRSTKIRKFDKTLVSVPNKAVTNEHIQNFSEMPVRRIKVYVGLSYEASTDKIKAVVQATRELLRTHPDIDQRFWMANLTEMSASSLDMIVYCFTRTTVWKEYMDIRQDVLLKIIDICNGHGVEIAFPTQTIYYKTEDGDSGMPLELSRGQGDDYPGAPSPGGTAGQPASTTQAAEFDSAEGAGES